MAREKLVRGKLVPLGPEEEAERDAEEAAWESATPQRAIESARSQRAAAYPPIGDQLDAIWKALDALSDQALNWPQETADMLAAIKAVKRENPLP